MKVDLPLENIRKAKSLKIIIIISYSYNKRLQQTVSWGCRIYQLLLFRGVRPHPNECPRYDIKQSDGEVPFMLELWEMLSTASLPSLSSSLRPGVVAPDRVLSIGQIELNCVLKLEWIACKRTVLTLKQHYYAKLNCLKWNCFCMLNWIVWNRTVFDIETELTLNWIIWNRTVLMFNCV